MGAFSDYLCSDHSLWINKTLVNADSYWPPMKKVHIVKKIILNGHVKEGHFLTFITDTPSRPKIQSKNWQLYANNKGICKQSRDNQSCSEWAVLRMFIS